MSLSHLTLSVRFIAHSYTGIRIREDRQEELDWPPSPGRLHEALLCAALLGVERSKAERDEVFEAFRWFEKLPAPEIWASHQDESLRTAPRLAIPQNNPKKSKLELKPSLLAPTRKAVSVSGEPLEVNYHWDVCTRRAPTAYVEILTDAAARISYLGRAEDRAEVALVVDAARESKALVRWQPNPGGHVGVWVAKAGCTDGLEERHVKAVPARECKRPAQRWMRSVRYSDDGPQVMQPIATAIFQLFPDDGDPDANAFSCDAESAGLWREFFRFHVVQLASDPDNWDDASLAAELLTGHSPPGKPASRPHLSIVPLPSINAAQTADGRVRRVALLGYAAAEVADAAESIYQTLFRALDDFVATRETPIRRSGQCIPVRLVQRRVTSDAIWQQLTGPARTWCSIIPVAISRGFKVPKFHPDGRELSSNERHGRRAHEWAELLRQSLKHIGLPDEVIAACSIESTATPLLSKSQRAEKYRAPGECSVLTHVRLEFPVRVRGPLVLGDRRYSGFGLFVPAPEVLSKRLEGYQSRQELI